MQILQGKQLLMLKKFWKVISDKHPPSSHSKNMTTWVHLSLTSITTTLKYLQGENQKKTQRWELKLFYSELDMLIEMIKKSGLQLCVGESFPLTTAPQHLQTYLRDITKIAQKTNKSSNSSFLLKLKTPSENIS